MADIRLRIEVNENAETETLGSIYNKVNGIGSVANISNTSFKAFKSELPWIPSGDFINLPEKQLVSGNNGLAMASDDGSSEYDFIFNDLDELDNIDGLSGVVEDETDPQEFIWGIVPSNKEYTVTLTFSNATSLKDIVILGDTVANQFPTEAIIDGTTTIYSDDPKWVINLGTESSTHTIQFTKWNRVNYNACLAWIRVTLKYLDLDKGWIDRFESNAQSTGDASAINYGVLANNGSADIRDLDGELQDLIIDGVLPVSQVPIEVYVNGNKIQEHIIQDTNYINFDKKLELDITNPIMNLKNIIVPEIKMTENFTAYSLLEKVLESVSLSNYISNMNEVPFSTYLNAIKIGYVHLESDTLENILNYFCEITQWNLIFDNNGLLKFINARPNMISNENTIRIPKSFTVSNLESSLVLKNKVKNVSFKEIQYIINNRRLPIIENQEGELSQILETFKDACIWSSDIFNNPQAIINDSSYIKEDYTDNNGETWKICYRKEVIETYTRCLTSINLGSPQMVGVLRDGNDVFTGGSANFLYSVYSSVDNFKLSLNNMSNTTNYHCCFLDKNFSIMQRDDDNVYKNRFTKEIQPIFAYKTNSNMPNFPIQFFIVSNVTGAFGSLRNTCPESKLFISESTVEYSNQYGNFEVSFLSNPLICNTTIYDSKKISKVISDNILSDYANGVSVAKIDVFCGDLYNSLNTKVKDWSQGEIIDVGDVVYFDDNLKADQSQRYWRVTGRKFKYEGAPTLSLELQEIVSIVQNS